MAGQKEVTDNPLDDKIITMGRIAGPYGVMGWSHVVSYTETPSDLLELLPWQLKTAGRWKEVEVAAGKRHGKGLVVKLVSCEDRDAAALNSGLEIGVARNRLPETEENEYYWSDLTGLQVVTIEGTELGVVDHLIETGSNDVLVVKGECERLVPFIQGQVIKKVDLESSVIEVDWDPDF